MVIEYEPLYYYKDENLIRDGEGNIVFDIFRRIPPNLLQLAKKKEEGFTYVDNKNHIVYELFYPEEGIDYE